ncbi:hypothetical protein CHISP_1075 [Chitinispirillum alkaliphilum]|nr:hypothetical protein CHISP_1075 [Chitinispirillum alkaliphilum]
MGLAHTSPSAMFWDHISYGELFDPLIWPNRPQEPTHYWSVEPALTAGTRSSEDGDVQLAFGNFKFVNDIRFGNLFMRQTLDVDSRYADDNLYPAHTGRFAQGRIEEAYIQYEYSNGFLRLGRIKRNWGPFPDRSMVLSSNPYSYDAFEWQLFSSFFEFRHLFAAFPYDRSYQDGGWEGIAGGKTNRYFAAHSLNFMLGKWVTLGLTETVVFARESGVPDFAYINPVSVYTVINTNKESEANLMLGFQWSVRPGTENIEWRGQLAVDDFQIDNAERTGVESDNEPNHWGIQTALYFRDLLPLQTPHLLKAEYTKASQWLYTVDDMNTRKGERYTYLGRSLGYPDNDFEKAAVQFAVIGQNYWTAAVEASYSRKGERNLFSKWKDSELDHIARGLPFNYQDSNFPSGEHVEKTIGFSTEISAYFRNLANCKLTLNNRWIKNRNNNPTARYEYVPRIHFEVSMHYSDWYYPFKR